MTDGGKESWSRLVQDLGLDLVKRQLQSRRWQGAKQSKPFQGPLALTNRERPRA